MPSCCASVYTWRAAVPTALSNQTLIEIAIPSNIRRLYIHSFLAG